MRHDPSVSDVVWTTLIPGGTAVMTGALGYGGARQQTRVELLKLKQKRDPGTAASLKFRQGLYLRYLDLWDVVSRLPTTDGATPDAFNEAFAALRRADDEMELFAAATVIPARVAVWGIADLLLKSWDGDGPDDGADYDKWFLKQLVETKKRIRKDWLTARANLVTAIRADVGPERPETITT
jgi:hypothetical protein